MHRRLALALLLVGGVVVPPGTGALGLSPAAAQTSPAPSAVEDFGYPDAAQILADTGIKLTLGDGHIQLASCTGTGLIHLWSFDLDAEACFKVNGPAGYLAMEMPGVYFIRGDGTHIVKAKVKPADGTAHDVDIERDGWTPIGAGTPASAEILLALDARPADGAARVLPVDNAHPYLARISSGAPGRSNSLACTGALVSQYWVLSAASCFAAGPSEPAPSTGPPPRWSTAAFGGKAPVVITHLSVRSDRDLALARLAEPITDIAPVAISGTAPTTGQVTQAAGYGRTATGWVPDRPELVTGINVSSVASATVGLTAPSGGGVCKGDTGGPIVNSGGAVVGVVTRSGQQGCLAASSTTTQVTVARADNLGAWVTDRTSQLPVFYGRDTNSGRCIDVDANNGDGAIMQIWDCQGTWNQKWVWNPADSTIRNPNGRCMDIANHGTANGATVWSWTCLGGANQKWVAHGDRMMRNPLSNRCLDVTNAGTANGSRLQIWDCNGGANQKFDIMRAHSEIRNRHPNQSERCLDSNAFNSGNGAEVQLYDCWGNWNQKFVANYADQTVRDLATGRCLDLEGPHGADGTKLVMWECVGRWSQRWVYHSDDQTLRNLETNKCADLTGYSNANGTRVQLYPCYTEWNQKWIPNSDFFRPDDTPPQGNPGSAAPVVEGNSGTKTVAVPVTLSAASGKKVTVRYAPYEEAGSAAEPEDFTLTSGTVTFQPGETSKTITIVIVGDAVDEPDENAKYRLSNPTNATVSTTPVSGVGILNDEVSIIPGWAAATVEGNSGTKAVAVPVTLSTASNHPITVRYAPYNASGWASYPADFDVGTGTLTFAPGELSKTITMTIKGDALDEPDEGAAFALSNPTDATVGGFGVGGVSIADDD